MGKLIPFGPKPARSAQTPSTTSDLRATKHSISGMLQDEFSSLGIEIDPVFKIQEYLMSLRGRVSKDSIAMGRILLRDTSTEELREIARNSTNLDWNARPGYFRALVDEMWSRR